MEPMSLTVLLFAVIWALLTGLIAALITYIILWLVSLVVTIEEGNRRRISAVVGALVALLSLVSRLG